MGHQKIEMESGEKGFYCSKRSPSWDDSQAKTGSCTIKDGGSSSNSTVEEGEKKPSVRPYVRSKMPRLRWTTDLHLRFVQAVERLGGQDRATPKSVLQLMGIKGLKIAHVKSHLQMYRSKKIDESRQGMTDHMLSMESIGKNIFGQLPFLPGLTQEQTSNHRYGDVSWNANGIWMHSCKVELNSTNKPGFHNPTTERIFNNHFYKSANLAHLCSRITSLNEEPTRKTNQDSKDQQHGSVHIQETWLSQSRQNPTFLNSVKLTQQGPNGSKRKASSYELDLNLSLAIESRNEEEQQGIVVDDEHLNLSIYARQTKKAKGENARGMSTLDLTL